MALIPLSTQCAIECQALFSVGCSPSVITLEICNPRKASQREGQHRALRCRSPDAFALGEESLCYLQVALSPFEEPGARECLAPRWSGRLRFWQCQHLTQPVAAFLK